ncbi:MAG: hypothetical protein FJ320_12015 [SAR202 cluster bacterium]|nr:hypothetical protein [SAR202 cluster bacterium]
MCLNCGCGKYDDDHGKSHNITTQDIEQAAEGEGMSVQETANEMIKGLEAASWHPETAQKA